MKIRATDKNDRICDDDTSGYTFSMSGSIAASGNIQTLLDKSGQKMDVPYGCYANLFFNCSSLTQAPLLPATTLDGSCYYQMFFGCTSLTKAPVLPAETLAYGCYRSIFWGCTSLTNAYFPNLDSNTVINEVVEEN